MNDFKHLAIFLRKDGPRIAFVDESFSNASNSGNSQFVRNAVDRVEHILQNKGENVDLDRYIDRSLIKKTSRNADEGYVILIGKVIYAGH